MKTRICPLYLSIEEYNKITPLYRNKKYKHIELNRSRFQNEYQVKNVRAIFVEH